MNRQSFIDSVNPFSWISILHILVVLKLKLYVISLSTGGTGDVAYAASSVYPDMKITVLELPPVVRCSSHFRPCIEECPNQQNVTFVEGDFFEGPLPSADLYALTRILHDWSEEKVDVILSNIFKSLPSGNRLPRPVCLYVSYLSVCLCVSA